MALPAAAGASSRGLARTVGEAKAPVGELRAEPELTLSGGATIYRYHQRVDGVPVLGSGAVVNDPPGVPPALVGDSTHESIEAPPSAEIGHEQAIAIARDGADATELRSAPRARLAIRPGEGSTLVWVVDLPSAQPLADFEVLVDARTGAVLSAQDLLRRFQAGHARLYKPNPVAQLGSYSGLKSDHNNTDTKLLQEVRERVRLKGINDGQHCLRGQWAIAKLHRAHRDVCRSSLNWRDVTRSNDKFEALMAYFHIDRAQRYIQSLDVGEPINERSTTAYADAIRLDNSFYSPISKKITYGKGGVDDAEDADVIVHEYGHAVQDNQDPGGFQGSGGAAMGEGFGDYMAVTLTMETPGLPDPARAALCVFDWDGVSYSPANPPCGRRSGISKGLDDLRPSCNLDPHCRGKVWSSALWNLRNALGTDADGRVIIDRVVLASHFLIATQSPSFQQGGTALELADTNLYGGVHIPQIHAELQDRDIF